MKKRYSEWSGQSAVIEINDISHDQMNKNVTLAY